MGVLDPFEVREVEVWPLPQFQNRGKKDPEAKGDLDALEFQIFQKAMSDSRFHAVLNEKEPSKPNRKVEIPQSARWTIVSDEVFAIRNHPDLRIARRASTLARLAQVISERLVQPGLRKTLLTQAKRLEWLAKRRYEGAPEAIEEEEGGDHNNSEDSGA